MGVVNARRDDKVPDNASVRSSQDRPQSASQPLPISPTTADPGMHTQILTLTHQSIAGSEARQRSGRSSSGCRVPGTSCRRECKRGLSSSTSCCYNEEPILPVTFPTRPPNPDPVPEQEDIVSSQVVDVLRALHQHQLREDRDRFQVDGKGPEDLR